MLFKRPTYSVGFFLLNEFKVNYKLGSCLDSRKVYFGGDLIMDMKMDD